ncbi:MAG TPA: porin family protein [Phnomibacter sp.]|nr:porin family protein [Phnomibacter sp.]
MKKRISFLLLCGVSLCSMLAPAVAQKPTFGVQAGATFSTWTGKVNGSSTGTDLKTGFTAGVLSNFDLGKNFVLQPSLNFTQKGMKESGAGAELVMLQNYIELPVNFLYRTKDVSQGHFFVGAGPSFGFAVSGKRKLSGPGFSEEHDLEIGSEDTDDIKPFDFGLNMLLGYQFANGLFVSANYSPGLINILPGNDMDDTAKNNCIGIRVGILFGSLK